MIDPAPVAAFRAAYRRDVLGKNYNGWLHLLLTSSVALITIFYSITRVHQPSALEWLTLPVTFVFANLVEYLGHKGPMHHPRPPLSLLYRRHTKQHHHFYTSEAMVATSHRDFHMVLFPMVMLLFFLGGIATPIALLLFVVASANVAWMFVLLATAYFLTYEWLHLCYHLPESSWVGKLPGMALLRRHHTLHHDLGLMGRWNFNITFPISDTLFGTLTKTGRG